MKENNRIYIDRVLPPRYAKLARNLAIEENPSNANPLEGTALNSRLWNPGRVLKIAFLDGSYQLQKKVARFACEWCNFANISFEFGSFSSADIRISFAHKGSWSVLGTEAKVESYFPISEPTMNFGWLNNDSTNDDYSVVLHEFGHALGLVHEHQNPVNGIHWNKKAVIDDLSGPPNFWDEENIEYNMFYRYEKGQTKYSKFDPNSIMIYPFPAHWTLDGFSIPENKSLSPTDKAFIQRCYP